MRAGHYDTFATATATATAVFLSPREPRPVGSPTRWGALACASAPLVGEDISLFLARGSLMRSKRKTTPARTGTPELSSTLSESPG
ncbi:hypothetical protein CMQ_4281 [Grosmannia clavigera kw1407]|uniref:Uncharacterized protein n=1 Tax=Grosmannia clavigera (strain kw1407 / UAMH 11150) TaxID=655863 RepID=F0XU46_GROCL|nr:uncharacterized protein CMQ_4281 [Grosmannia clavigera kw1407]EFW98429.1 hypothetical protein CMQ_4281 [Grosmannia clavigera kw1407]